MLEVIDKFCPVEFSVELVNLLYLFAQLGEVSFRQASHYIQTVQVALFLSLAELKNHIYRLLLGIANETAGVYYRYLTARLVTVMDYLIAALLQLTHKMLRIDKILRASHSYYVNTVLLHRLEQFRAF